MGSDAVARQERRPAGWNLYQFTRLSHAPCNAVFGGLLRLFEENHHKLLAINNLQQMPTLSN
jgi:hypothetical protein